MSQYLDALVDRADLDEIIREIDALCAKREWNELASLRNKCAAAVKTGRQVWPAATLANYRLALHADAKNAAESLQHPTSTFSVGPLTEVIAQSHSWNEIEKYITDPPMRGFVAYERAIRGDTIENDESLQAILEIPLALGTWEPSYEVPLYSDNGVEAPTPLLTAVPFNKVKCNTPILNKQYVV
jgi:hypothetical protein